MSSEAFEPNLTGLLSAASLVLRTRGFEVAFRTVTESGHPMVLAENELFLLGVVEFGSADELAAVESLATLELADQLEHAGAKRWDAYLVLLTTTISGNQAMSAAVADIVYNTRYVRRIIRWGLAAEPGSVAEALRPFFGLPALADGSLAQDPIRRLADRITAHGVVPAEADSAVNLWLSSESKAAE